MANPKLSVIASREELGTASRTLLDLLKGNKKINPVPSMGENKLIIMMKPEKFDKKKLLQDLHEYMMKDK